MKKKAIILLLGIVTAACGFLGQRPTAASSPVPTFLLNLPTETSLPPTLVPFYTPTATPAVKWPVATLTIVSSLPMSGPSQAASKAMVNAETLRLQQAKYQACKGKYRLAFEPLDAANKKPGAWDPVIEGQNVTIATEDPSVIAYLGAVSDEAAKLVVPMLDQAGPMVVISMGAGYPGLTKPDSGVPSEPDIYYPAGIRNFARVVPNDGVQAKIAAEFMAKELGVKTAFIIDDEEPYGYAMAHNFDLAARRMGITVLGHEAISPKARDYQSLMWRIAASNYGHAPDAVFASMLAGNNAGQFLKDKVDVLGNNMKVKFVGPSGILDPSLIDGAGANAAEGAYATAAGAPFPDGLTEAGQQFMTDYKASYGPLNEPTAIYAYDAMNVLLKAIEDVCAGGGDPTSRRQVRDAVFAIRNFSGVLGTWSFDENGDTSLSDVMVYEVKDGVFEVVGKYK